VRAVPRIPSFSSETDINRELLLVSVADEDAEAGTCALVVETRAVIAIVRQMMRAFIIVKKRFPRCAGYGIILNGISEAFYLLYL
jgi:hypothetical protein